MSNYSTEERNRIVKTLQSLGIRRCIIEYSGGGDSGSIEGVNCSMTDDDDKFVAIKELLEADSDNAIRIAVRDRLLGHGTTEFETQVTDLCYGLLDHLGVPDWVNNDGGQGTITIYPFQDSEDNDIVGVIEVDHKQFYTETNESSYTL